MIWLILGVATTTFLSGAFSGMETGVYSLERVRLQIKAAGGDRRARRLLDLLMDPPRAICTLLVMNNAVNFALTAFAGAILVRLTSSDLTEIQLELLNTLYVVPVLFVFGELVPKNLFLRYPEHLARWTWPIYRGAAFLVWPLVTPILGLVRLMSPRAANIHTLVARQSVVSLLTEGDEAAALSPTQRHLVSQVLAFRSATAEERMVPMPDVAWVREDDGRDAVLDATQRSGRSRILVMDREGRCLGYVTVMDATFDADGADWRARDGAISMPTVAPDATGLEVLRTLRSARRPLAAVALPGGPPMGLVSKNDLVVGLVRAPR
jgi:putative hemolysin